MCPSPESERRKRQPGEYGPRHLERLRALLVAGATYRQAGAALGVSKDTARKLARRHGLPRSSFDSRAPRGEAFRRKVARAMRAAALRRECESIPEYQRLRRLRRYMAMGYPPGVTSERQRQAFDLMRARGGLTGRDLMRLAPCGWSGARRALGALVYVGAAEAWPGVRVGSHKPCRVYRVARAWLDRAPRRAAGA